ncbi:cytochrome P450 3A41 [Parasteatoda tepidariorum]|uniref:Cytochrome P450 3A24 n=1 Tax=Parasteatoda tepidariorum TaxID=114398 RepID=A0A2L2Y209_PARTP|nr:cytochrome P450 3A41 [Parasteatoda tepidariorum]
MDTTLTLLGVFLSVIVIFIFKWALRRHSIHQTWKRYGIPGPEPDFLTGNLRQLKKDPTPNYIISDWIKKYGNVVGYYVGEDVFVVIKDLEILKKVLIKDIGVFSNRPTLFLEADPFPKTLVGLRDKRWKEVRNIVTPTFSSGKIKQMTDIVSKKVDITVDLIVKESKRNEAFNIYKMVQGLTLDVIAACALAMKTSCQENPNDALLTNVRTIIAAQYNKLAIYSILFPFMSKVLKLLESATSFKQAIDFIVNHLKSVIKERRKDTNFKSKDILQTLLESSEEGTTSGSGTKLTEEEVVAQAFVVFLAGYETTATALAFTFHLLVTHPEIQDRLYEEIKDVKDSDYATIQGLQYLDQVFNESLRLYPPVTGFTSRVCDQDYDIGPHTIPKNAHVFVPVWDLQHDPEYWPEPYKFDPDRFSPENKGSIKNMTYMPFGAGPRNCIGARFAQLEAKMIIFKLLKKVKLQPSEKTEKELTLHTHTVITYPKNGVWLKAVLRN